MGKQILRACGAQDDRLARFGGRERETTLPLSLSSSSVRHVILSEARGTRASRRICLWSALTKGRSFASVVKQILRACGAQDDKVAPSILRKEEGKAERDVVTPSRQAG